MQICNNIHYTLQQSNLENNYRSTSITEVASFFIHFRYYFRARKSPLFFGNNLLDGSLEVWVIDELIITEWNCIGGSFSCQQLFNVLLSSFYVHELKYFIFLFFNPIHESSIHLLWHVTQLYSACTESLNFWMYKKCFISNTLFFLLTPKI